jgi:hypothetical protein
VEAHPGRCEQLRQWCGGMMPGVLPPNNVALVIKGRQPTPTYQPLGGYARIVGHTKAARCPRHYRYLSASQACVVSCIVMLHLQSKDTTMYVRNLLTGVWKAAGGSITNVSMILASCGTASSNIGKQRTRSMGLYVNCCVRGPSNPVSYELVQRGDIHIVHASTRACCPPRVAEPPEIARSRRHLSSTRH